MQQNIKIQGNLNGTETKALMCACEWIKMSEGIALDISVVEMLGTKRLVFSGI